ncbi:MAG: hypothetical protein QXP97_01170 [Desulfurococcus sp.]
MHVATQLNSRNYCFYPWILSSEDETFIVVYNILEGILIYFNKKENSINEIIDKLESMGFVRRRCEYYVDEFIPLSPLMFSIKELSPIKISRIDLIIPLGLDAMMEPFDIPFICDTHLIKNIHKNGIVNSISEIEPYLEEVRKFINNVEPIYLVVSFGRIKNVDIFKELLLFVNTLSARFKTINIYYRDYLENYHDINKVFTIINISTYIDDVSSNDFNIDEINKLKSENMCINYALIVNKDYPYAKVAEVYDRLVIKDSFPHIILPNNIKATEETLKSVITKLFIKMPSYENMALVYYGNYSPCSYGMFALLLTKSGLRPCICQHYCLDNEVSEIDISTIRKIISKWVNPVICEACSFRLACFYCRYSVTVGSRCITRAVLGDK